MAAWCFHVELCLSAGESANAATVEKERVQASQEQHGPRRLRDAIHDAGLAADARRANKRIELVIDLDAGAAWVTADGLLSAVYGDGSL